MIPKKIIILSFENLISTTWMTIKYFYFKSLKVLICLKSSILTVTVYISVNVQQPLEVWTQPQFNLVNKLMCLYLKWLKKIYKFLWLC